MSDLMVPKGPVLFEEGFREGLGEWVHEGGGKVEIARPGVMLLDCTGSQQGGVGTQAFCRRDFPDGIALEYDLLVKQSNGLVITFFAMRGLRGEDALTELPPRAGRFGDYVGEDAPMRSYHVSVSRYDDQGVHTGVSNVRRNPGCHLVSQGPDLCQEIGRSYHVTIIKDGRQCQVAVDGRVAHDFVDPDELPDEIPGGGKLGFRAIGSLVLAEVSGLRVRALR